MHNLWKMVKISRVEPDTHCQHIGSWAAGPGVMKKSQGFAEAVAAAACAAVVVGSIAAGFGSFGFEAVVSFAAGGIAAVGFVEIDGVAAAAAVGVSAPDGASDPALSIGFAIANAVAAFVAVSQTWPRLRTRLKFDVWS